MRNDTTTFEIGVSNDVIATEVALGIIGRAGDLHYDANPNNENIAVELRDVGQSLLADYPVAENDYGENE